MARIYVFIAISRKLEKAVSFKNLDLSFKEESGYKSMFL